MTVMAFVLSGSVLVTAASLTADWCKAQWPALFGLTRPTEPAREHVLRGDLAASLRRR